MNIRASFSFQPGNAAAIQQAIVLRAVNAVTRGTDAVKAEAQTLCPVGDPQQRNEGDQPHLRDTIKSVVSLRGNMIEGTVYAEADHAGFVEFGTGLIGRGTYPFALPQSGVPYTDSWIYDFRGRGWKGMPAKPYMRPALDYAGPQIIGFFRAEGFQV